MAYDYLVHRWVVLFPDGGSFVRLKQTTESMDIPDGQEDKTMLKKNGIRRNRHTDKLNISRRKFIVGGVSLALAAIAPKATLASPLHVHGKHNQGDYQRRRRVVVSTDIGGTDPDDYQSMVHLLVSADRMDLEGLISSPFGSGRKQDILDVIDIYAKDYPNLSTWSSNYPTPSYLRGITKQGATASMGFVGYGQPSEGSAWIVHCARKPDLRPLHVLVWGGIDDLAQALHDAPDILPKLRVYYIGGPNKKWSADAYQYIADHCPTLSIIEANSTYRGWFVGGDQNGDYGNSSFVEKHIADYGHLGEYFATKLSGTIKMGDTPSVAWVLNNDTADPASAGWGGQFVRAWERPHKVFDHLTSTSDKIEQFGVAEFRFLVQPNCSETTSFLEFENQKLKGYWNGSEMCFRCSPKKATTNKYSITSKISKLDGKKGQFKSFVPPIERLTEVSSHYPNWWTDTPDPQWAEGKYQGAKSVNQWRHEFLDDFAVSMRRCANPA